MIKGKASMLVASMLVPFSPVASGDGLLDSVLCLTYVTNIWIRSLPYIECIMNMNFLKDGNDSDRIDSTHN